MSPSDYEGLHHRYAIILNGEPARFIAGREDKEEELRKKLSLLFDGMMKALYKSGGAQLSIDILADSSVRKFIDAHASILDSGFEQVKMSDAMRRRLQRSDFIFSGLKTFHELNEAFPALIDENGDRKPFERFLNDVRTIDESYNRNYLRAEYNFAVASAEMAARWEGFMKDGDRYNLQYRTQNDEHVRPEHAALDGVTLPPSDPFWEEYYPPNGWNCRCTVVQVRKSKYPVTPHDEAMALGEQALQKDSKGIFRFNPGIEQKTFPDYNPYSIRRCRDCDIAKGKTNLAKPFIPDNELCAACLCIRSFMNAENERRLTKEERKEIARAALEWAERHLPKVPNPDGTLMSRLTSITSNGDTILIGKKFFSETFAKNIHNKRLAKTMELATHINEWIGLAKCKGNEPGKHHNFDFRIYEVEYKGQIIQLKAKVTDGFLAYNMKLL